MNTSEQPNRLEMAEKIKKKPGAYKVCEGCGSIVMRKTAVCPNCNAYRFNLETSAVLEQADILAARDPLSIDKDDYV